MVQRNTNLNFVCLADARKSCHALSMHSLDFANAYGSVPHWLIMESFKLHDAPSHLMKVLNNLYSNQHLSISMKKWSTLQIPCNIGVFQGDPFSVMVFNTCINTLVLHLQQTCPKPGYTFNNPCHSVSTLLFADDISLLSKSS